MKVSVGFLLIALLVLSTPASAVTRKDAGLCVQDPTGACLVCLSAPVETIWIGTLNDGVGIMVENGDTGTGIGVGINKKGCTNGL